MLVLFSSGITLLGVPGERRWLIRETFLDSCSFDDDFPLPMMYSTRNCGQYVAAAASVTPVK